MFPLGVMTFDLILTFDLETLIINFNTFYFFSALSLSETTHFFYGTDLTIWNILKLIISLSQ